MSVYMTEEEQLEAIKKWWNKYSNVITIALSLVLFIFAAYRYWNWHQEKVIMQASATYENLMIAFSNQDNDSVQSYVNQLTKDYRKTIYADSARLILAKLFVSQDNYDQAKKELEQVAANSKMKALKQVARIRIARLLANKKDYNKALTELTAIDDKAYMPIINELKGDIYAARGQYQQALASYKEAITEVHTNGMGNLFLEMKTNELAALSQSTSTESSKIQAA